MSETTLKQDIDAMYKLAERTGTLAQLVPSLCDVMRRHPDELAGITYSYRLLSTDTKYSAAFALANGVYTELDASAPTDVTVSGTEKHLMAIFQRKLNPVMALVLGKIKLNGNKIALVKLAEFL